MGGRKELNKPSKEEMKRKLVSYTPPPEDEENDPTPDRTIRDEDKKSSSSYESPVSKSVEKLETRESLEGEDVSDEEDWSSDSDSSDVIVVKRFPAKETINRAVSSIDKMYEEINDKISSYSESSFTYPFLNGEFWEDFRVVKCGTLYSFKLHFHEMTEKWEIVLRKRNTKYSNATYFYWDAQDTKDFLASLEPLAKKIRGGPIENLLGNKKFWEKDIESFFKHEATINSPNKGIAIRPFVFEENPNKLYLKWFQRSQQPVTLKNKNNQEFTWNGYNMITSIPDYIMLVKQIRKSKEISNFTFITL